MTSHQLKDVFGIHKHQLKSYASRNDVDGRFAQALKGDHHVVVYGSSKQGKTSLRLKHLSEKDCTVVRCGPRMGLIDLYTAILRLEGAKIHVSESTRTQDKTGSKLKFPLTEGSAETTNARERRANYLPHNLEDAQSVGEILLGLKFAKFIVLENFHYLAPKTQRAFARDLKTFHEIGIRFIILGIWRESNMLLIHNPDLLDRITEIPVEPWKSDDFDKVIKTGCELLNITIVRDVLARFKAEALGNIGMLQEFLRLYCEVHGVVETQERTLDMVSNVQAHEVLVRKCDEHRAQLVQVLQQISARSSTGNRDPLLLPYYLVRCLLTLPLAEIEAGITKPRLLECIREMHHRQNKETIRSGDITHLVRSLRQLQVELGTPFLYYNNNTLRICLVDTRHFFVLNRVNRDDILNEIPDPAEELARRTGSQTRFPEDPQVALEESEEDDEDNEGEESFSDIVHDENWDEPAESEP